MKKITSLQQLADFINENSEWPLAAEKIIEENGWISDTGSEYGICHTDSETLEFNESGEAVVRSR